MSNSKSEKDCGAPVPGPRGEGDGVDTHDKYKHTWRIWCIFLLLALMAFLSAIDSTIITTTLPTITREIGGSSQYAWIANSYLFASTVPQPLYGQLANIFGRRNPLLVAMVLFAIGSGLAGGARNAATLIAARTVQGLGTSGLYVLPEIIICDLLPPRHRGPFLSALLSTAALGTTIGPIIGGAIVRASWRWIFWINLPVLGIVAVGIVLLLRVDYKRSPTILSALSRVDWAGNFIFIPSLTATFFGLIMGGNTTIGFPWASWRIILPIVIGFLGWITYHFYEASRFCREPSTPSRLFKNRTSVAGFILIFLAAIVLQATSYFLPLYFQAIKGASPLLSGVYYLPFTLALIPLAAISGAFMSKTGLYRPVHWAGFVLSAVGVGLFSVLDEASSRGAWIGYQIIAAGGSGFVFTVTLPSTLAPLDESDVAAATSTYSFIRSFGLVWGATMSSIIFNNRVNAHLDTVTDPSIRRLLADGGAYSYAGGLGDDSPNVVDILPDSIRGQVVDVYVQALRVVWFVFAGVSVLGFFATLIEKHVELRKEHNTEFGLSGDEKSTKRRDDWVQSSPKVV